MGQMVVSNTEREREWSARSVDEKWSVREERKWGRRELVSREL